MTKTNSKQVTRKLAKEIVAERDEALAARNSWKQATEEATALVAEVRAQRDAARRELAEARAALDSWKRAAEEQAALVAEVRKQRDEARAERDALRSDLDQSHKIRAQLADDCRARHVRAEAAEAELARRATGDETTSEGYYRREWESACERIRAAEAARDRLREALEAIAHDPHCVQGGTGSSDRLSYRTGVEDGHRCAAAKARAALAGSAPARTNDSGMGENPNGPAYCGAFRNDVLTVFCEEPAGHVGDHRTATVATAHVSWPRDNETAPQPITKAEVEAALADGAPHARASMATLNGREDKLCGRCGFLFQDCRCRPPEGAEPETAPPPSGDPSIPDAKDAVPGHAQSDPGVRAGVSGAGSGGGAAPNPPTSPPASAGDNLGAGPGPLPESDTGPGRVPPAESGRKAEFSAPSSSPPSEPEPGAPHDWYFDNGDIYCKRCSANHGELVSRPCAARAAVPEEPGEKSKREFIATLTSLGASPSLVAAAWATKAPETPAPAAAPKVEDPPPGSGYCPTCGIPDPLMPRLAALEEVARALVGRPPCAINDDGTHAKMCRLCRALAALDRAARLKETT